MPTERSAWRLTIASPDGHPLFTLLAQPIEDPARPAEPAPPAPSRARPAATNGSDPDARMTDPQKRYLFRLLAEQGVEGKQAEEHLKDQFKVRALRDVTKVAASQLIEQMVADRKEVRDGTA